MTYTFRSLLLPVVLISTSFAVAQNKALTTRPAVRVTAKIDRKARVTLPGTHPSVVARSTMGGRLAGGTQLQHMVLVLNASDEQNAALQALMDAQQDKASPSYHQWLTPDTFGASFGVASPDIAQVSAWLADSGLPVESVSRSGRFITFSGTVSAVETAFNTEMHNLIYNGEAHISNTTDVSVPAALSSVVKGVARLNNFFPKSPIKNLGKVTIQKNPPNSVELNQPDYNSLSTGRHYVGARDMATIYNATPLTNAGIDGKGISISVLARSNITLADVEVYRSFFGLPKNDPNIIVVGSDPGENPDDIEAFLDAEMAGAIATGATVNFIVSSPSLVGEGIDTAGLYAVDNNIGDIITLSYGGCESSNGASGTAFWNVLWEEAAAQGQTAFVSSGDSGAAGCDSSSAAFSTRGYGVNALGSSNFNVAVGGSMFVDFSPAQYWATGPTVIPYSTALGYVPEAALNQSRITTTLLNDASTAYVTGSGIFAGGGGISIYTPRPSWQTGSGISLTADPTAVTGTGIASATDAIAGPHRLVPDLSFISANGHDATIFCAEGVCSENSAGGVASLGLVGGTSVAAPAMASAQALIDAANGGRQGNANYYYYSLAAQQYNASTTACQSINGTAASPTVTLPAPTCNFQDITAGSITVPTAASGTAGIGFNAGTGYDAATGLGSVNIANAANNWKTVAFNSTTTTLSLTPQTAAHGSNQSGLIQVSSNSGTPTGDVSIIASSTATGFSQVYSLTGGAVNAIVNSLPGGTYNVHAHYAGDGTYAASDSAPVAVTISQEASTFVAFQPSLITSAGGVSGIFSANYGAGEIYIDTELSSISGNGVASGNVVYTIQQNGVPLPGLTTSLDTYGTTYIIGGPPFANFYLTPNYPTFTPGTYTVTATYSGDASLTGATSTAAFTINKATPTVSYTAGTADVSSGAPAILNFSITTPAAAAPASGTVTFTDTTTGTVLGTPSLVNGRVVFSTTAITTSGAHSIAAAYSGDTNYNPATPTALAVNVTSAAAVTGTILTASTTAPSVGTSVTLTAFVYPLPTLASTVSFYDGPVLLGSSAVSLVTGKATLAVTSFTAGTHYPTGNYAGSTNQLTSIGFVQINVSRSSTTISVSGGETSTLGQQVVFNGTISRNPSSAAVPAVALTGAVNFYEGSTAGALLGSVVPTFGPGGYGFYTATFSTSTLAAGQHSIVASYPGDANFAGSTSIAAPLVVKVNQTITFTGLPATAVYGAADPYVLTASSTSGLPIVYTVSGPATISGNILTITGLGTVVVTASQPGNTYNNPATPVSLSILITTGSIQLSSSATATKTSAGYLVAVTIRNTGSSPATNVQIASVTIGSTTSAAAVGTVAAGSSVTTTLPFPASAGASGTTALEKVVLTYTGGSFSGTYRIALP